MQWFWTWSIFTVIYSKCVMRVEWRASKLSVFTVKSEQHSCIVGRSYFSIGSHTFGAKWNCCLQQKLAWIDINMILMIKSSKKSLERLLSLLHSILLLSLLLFNLFSFSKEICMKCQIEIKKNLFMQAGHQISRCATILHEYIYENENIHSQKWRNIFTRTILANFIWKKKNFKLNLV